MKRIGIGLAMVFSNIAVFVCGVAYGIALAVYADLTFYFWILSPISLAMVVTSIVVLVREFNTSRAAAVAISLAPLAMIFFGLYLGFNQADNSSVFSFFGVLYGDPLVICTLGHDPGGTDAGCSS